MIVQSNSKLSQKNYHINNLVYYFLIGFDMQAINSIGVRYSAFGVWRSMFCVGRWAFCVRLPQFVSVCIGIRCSLADNGIVNSKMHT